MVLKYRCLPVLLLLPVWSAAIAQEPGFSARWDIAARIDKRTERDWREQYRLRFYPQYQFDAHWSLHGFVASGDNFSSSYNTLGSDSSPPPPASLVCQASTGTGQNRGRGDPHLQGGRGVNRPV